MSKLMHIAPVAAASWSPVKRAWLAFLDQVQPDPEMRLFLQRLAGSAALGIPGKETVAIHYGGGANGKSTWVESIRDVLGRDYCAEVAPEALVKAKGRGMEMERHLYPLPGKRLATTLEPDEGQSLNESAIKRVTSSEPVVGRGVFRNGFEFTPVCTVMMATNHRPDVGGTDDGIWRRVALIPWSQCIPEDQKDIRFREKMVAAESAGILAWVVRGARDFLANGLPRPSEVSDATADYRVESDVVGAFLDESCQTSTNDSLFCPAGELYEAFCAYLRKQGEPKMTNRAFADRMKRRGVPKRKTNTGARWLGLDLTLAIREELSRSGGARHEG
jgi:putative DNA primase/helicase